MTRLIAKILLGSCALATSVPAMADNDEAVWQMANAKIASVLKGLDANYGDKYLIQLPATPLYANWLDTTDKLNKFGVYSLYDVSDNITTWGPTYTPAARSFAEAYGSMISAINLSNGGSSDSALQAKWQLAQTKYLARTDKARDEWIAFDRAQRKKPKSTWVAQNAWYQKHANGDLNVLKTAMLDAYNKYKNTLNLQQVQYAKLIDGYSRQQPVTIIEPESAQNWNMDPEDPTTWVTKEWYPYSVDLNQLRAITNAGKAQFAAGTPLYSWTLDKNAEKRVEEQRQWSASASYGFYFSGSASGSHHSIDLNKDGTYLRYSFYGIGIVPITTAGNWYSGTLLRQFTCGPFTPPPVGSPAITPASLWGENGSLGTRAVAVVVAFKPQIEGNCPKANIITSGTNLKYLAG